MMSSNINDELGDEVEQADASERGCLPTKENDYSLKLRVGSSMTQPSENGPENFGRISFQRVQELNEEDNVNRILCQENTSNRSFAIPRFMDDTGNTVEDLIVRDYESNLAMIGSSYGKDRAQTRHHMYHPGSSGAHFGWGTMPFDECTSQIATTSANSEAVAPPNYEKLSKSGFYEFFVKNTLKGKGAISKSQRNDDQIPLVAGAGTPSTHDASETEAQTLREWINADGNASKSAACLALFKQIVELVDSFHSKGLVLRDLRPSFFKWLHSDQVKYCGSFTSVEKDSVDEIEPSSKRQKVTPSTSLSKKLKLYMISAEAGLLNETSEENWYASPEELQCSMITKASNIYSTGVFLFELLSCFKSRNERMTAMSNLRHRILPPHFLSEHAKEAGYCVWLLHPEPYSRPTTSEILGFQGIWATTDTGGDELPPGIEQDDADTEVLLHFLHCLRESKQTQAMQLSDAIKNLENDFEDVFWRNYSRHSDKKLVPSDIFARASSSSALTETRFVRNMNQLETAYFSMRSEIQQNNENTSSDSLGSFFDGLCKYARYSKFEVRGMLKTGDFNNSANVICSLSFDRDSEYFAAAGVSKKIKIFEFNSLLNKSYDIYYPVTEMPNKSKISCVCWNSYIKNYLASTGYDGVVRLWDVSTGQGVFEYSEHEKRAWSVDFSPVFPTKFASGSDDCSVKLWNINEKSSNMTIKNIANVCCVQFSHHSMDKLAFGSADYRTYCYDLRNTRTPWCVLSGHEKAVSYVKFLDSQTIITASTDSSLKIWDLSNPAASACSLTLRGHTNEKNFVGLSVANGYITCGSETNEVYAYYRSLPMPLTSHKFGSIDPVSDKETEEANGYFVSSVCWKGDSDMAIAANSSGCIKVLQMV